MQIDKNMIVNLLREKGSNQEAEQAQSQLPDRVDPAEHGGMLSKFGLDPQELISKFAGGGSGGGAADILGNITKKF